MGLIGIRNSGSRVLGLGLQWVFGRCQFRGFSLKLFSWLNRFSS